VAGQESTEYGVVTVSEINYGVPVATGLGQKKYRKVERRGTCSTRANPLDRGRGQSSGREGQGVGHYY